MIQLPSKAMAILRLLAASLLPTLVLVGVRWRFGVPFHWTAGLQIWLFVIGVLYLTPLGQPKLRDASRIGFQPASLGLFILALGLGFREDSFTILGDQYFRRMNPTQLI